jgi:hypothetical protein
LKEGGVGFSAAAIVLGLQVVLGVGAGPGAEAGPNSHCLVVEVVRPTSARLVTLVKMLSDDRLSAALEGGLLTVQLGPVALARVFGGRFVRREVAAGASDRTVRATYVEGVRIPTRYRGWIASIQVGHQICE